MRGVSLEFLDTVPFVPQRFFSARWRGFWYVAESGELELHGAGDDRLDVWLDGVLVISRRPPADMHTQVRTLVVDAGVHSIWIDYEQHGGAHALSLRWARPGGPPRPFARHRLFHESPVRADIRLARHAARLEPIVILIWALPVAAAGVFLTRRLWNSRRKALRLATVLAGAAVVLRAVLARLPGWNPESLWGDDVIYGSLIRSADVWSVIVTPVHAAPGLFVIWRWLSAVFPDPEWSLQILPFACGIAAIPTMALAARRLTGDDSLALLAAAVTALNPLLAFYTVYVHQYSFDFLVTALLMLAAAGLAGGAHGVDPRRFGRMTLGGGLAAFFSAPSLLVSFPLVHLGAALAMRDSGSSDTGRTARARVLAATAAYDVAVLAAVLFLRNRTNERVRGDFGTGFMPFDTAGAAWNFLAEHGRRAIEMSLPNWTGQGLPEWDLPDTVSWPLPFVALGLIWLLARRQTRFCGLVAAAVYTAIVVASVLHLYPLGVGRPDVFAFPVGILLFTAGIWLVTEPLPCRSQARVVAAAAAVAMALSHAVPVTYRPRNDARLARELATQARADDWIMLSFSAGYLAAYYGPWNVEIVPVDTSTAYVATIVRERVLHLPLRLDYDDSSREHLADTEHRRILEQLLEESRPERIWFLGYHTELVTGRDWGRDLVGVLIDNGYRIDEVSRATRGALYVGVLP